MKKWLYTARDSKVGSSARVNPRELSRGSKIKSSGCLCIICSALFVALLIPLIDKSLPLVRANESFRAEFPVESFLEKMAQPVPDWMVEQIERDFSEFKGKRISAEALQKTHEQICERVTTVFHRYRIVSNRLYRFVPDGSPFLKIGSILERAIKTLLVYAEIPDVDFILCYMDGLPEPYMPPQFFILEDESEQAPILAQAKLRGERYIALVPDQFSLRPSWIEGATEVLNQQIDWSQKRAMVSWRGGFTDGGVPDDQPVTEFATPRFQLCKLSIAFPERIDAGFNWVGPAMEGVMQQEGVFRESLSKLEQVRCKYLPVLDGHMCTYPGYQWRLLSGSLCLKQNSEQVQWFYGALQPYKHYLPMRSDCGDLLEVMKWADTHDAQAQEIALTAQEFARNNLLFADNYLYLSLVLKKLASLEEIDFEETHRNPQWVCIQYRKRLVLQKSFRYF